MGNNVFAYDYKPPSTRASFIVRNISSIKKLVLIFDYPIPFGMERDLLSIPGIGEGEIRASCLKGEIRTKLLAQEVIIVHNDADLLQFNQEQKNFLKAYGVDSGIEVGSSSITNELSDRIDGGGTGGITASEHARLRQFAHFLDNGPGEGFASGAVRVTSPSGNPFPTSITWFIDGSLTTKIVEKLITYNGNQVPTAIVWHLFDTDGTTVLHTATDTITYVNNVFEYQRTRVFG